jgi:hypothetical protein
VRIFEFAFIRVRIMPLPLLFFTNPPLSYTMQLLNLGFAILIIKIAICILPGVLGLFMILSSEEKKRDIRNELCSKLFGVSNAIPYPKFERTLQIIGVLLLLFSAAATWFVHLRQLF